MSRVCETTRRLAKVRDRRFLALALRIGPSFPSYFFSQRCHRPLAKGARARKGRASLPGREDEREQSSKCTMPRSVCKIPGRRRAYSTARTLSGGRCESWLDRAKSVTHARGFVHESSSVQDPWLLVVQFPPFPIHFQPAFWLLAFLPLAGTRARQVGKYPRRNDL